MKTNKIIFYASTGLLTVMMLMSAGMYFFNYEEVAGMFTNFGYPAYIIQPYGVVKILGLVALWFFRGKFINEWAYAGFFFAFILAFFAHFMIGDGEQWGALIAMVLLLVSYFFGKKVQNG
ncbi:DoxX family protein [Tenacibaculum aquimarinum]|uniref:DoxX family protein n=1 Tax=Tenacibaculum aquimarinum TaxID=2910675 RepID=UPI001F0AF8BB|nr:DoxX family protein [Tenacibaculum aquimarinum]MCH3883248.1 DoxX family protein [Tenacibaculum aquimarinum]